jgi:hypothetical protein
VAYWIDCQIIGNLKYLEAIAGSIIGNLRHLEAIARSLLIFDSTYTQIIGNSGQIGVIARLIISNSPTNYHSSSTNKAEKLAVIPII